MKNAISIERLRAEELTFHPEINSGQNKEKEKPLIRLATNFDSVLGHAYPPIILKDNNGNCQLIARKWVYAHLIYSGVFEFNCVVIHDEGLLEQIAQLLQIETNYLSSYEQAGQLPRAVSRATETRRKAIKAGQTCPLCGGPLRSPRGKKILSNGYKISCENKSRKDIMCEFEALLTQFEYDLFRQYKLPTEMWLSALESTKCHRCGQSMFLRTVRNSAEAPEQPIKRCKSKYTGDKSCLTKQLGGGADT